MSGRRDSNPRPSAWKANALSTELLPQICGGQGWIRTTEGVSQQIYSLPHLATLVLAQQYFKKRAEDGAQTRDPQLGRLMLYRLSYFRNFSGQRWIRTTEGVSQQIYSLPHLATLVFAQLLSKNTSIILCFSSFEPLVGFEPTTPRLQITCSGQLS